MKHCATCIHGETTPGRMKDGKYIPLSRHCRTHVMLLGDNTVNLADICEDYEEITGSCFQIDAELNRRDTPNFSKDYPDSGDDYWYVDKENNPMCTEWSFAGIDIERFENGNCFKTGREAQAHQIQILLDIETAKLYKEEFKCQ